MRSAALLLAALAALAAGCGSTAARDDLEARLIVLESRLSSVERRADTAVTLRERIDALEAVLAAPPPGPDAEVAARLAALEAHVAGLEGRMRALEAAEPATAPADGGAAAPGLPAPPGAAASPPDGAEVEVLSAGGGGLLLVRSRAGLHRVRMLGVEAPERAEVYGQRADLRARHAAAFGPAAVRDDAAFEASRAHLEALLRRGPVTLSYGDGPRMEGGAVVAYLTVTPPDEAPIDVNGALVRDGYALAAPGHLRGPAYQELEAQARADRRGLHAVD
ncbi:MAG: thermonuclease family protein [Planctomycetes bacterium]|nr:thermonuclease family protein [Planctomycetota bacterium]